MGQLFFIANGGSGGGGPVSMQLAYNGGPDVNMTALLGGIDLIGDFTGGAAVLSLAKDVGAGDDGRLLSLDRQAGTVPVVDMNIDDYAGPAYNILTNDNDPFSSFIGLRIINEDGFYLNVSKDEIRWTQTANAGEDTNLFIIAPADEGPAGTLFIHGLDFIAPDTGESGGDIIVRGGNGAPDDDASGGGAGANAYFLGGDGGGSFSGSAGAGGNSTYQAGRGGNSIGGGGTGGVGGIASVFGGKGGVGTTYGIGGALLLLSGSSDSGLGEETGSVTIGFGDALNDGGFFMDATSGVVELRQHSIAGGSTASLRLPQLTEASELLLSTATGLFHYRKEQSAGAVLDKGFRAYRDDSYSLVGRGYQRTFDSGDLSGSELTVVHDLDTRACIVVVYNDTGTLLLQGTDFNVVETDEDETLVDFLVAVVGTWRITIMGF